METAWRVLETENPSDIERLAAELEIPYPIAKLLVLRGVSSMQEALDFFEPSINDLHSPFLMKDMDKAVKRLLQAINLQQKITVFGDYDVDGTTGASLLFLAINKLGAKVDYFIPERVADGYGLSKHAIEKLINDKTDLIISVDCGITAIDEVLFATANKVDIIICDHHRQATSIPQAIAVLNPKRFDCTYPFKDLAGCGVAFKFMQAVYLELKQPFSDLEQLLDLVSVGSAADIVPLLGENRYLVRQGLLKLNSNPSLGLKALIKISQFSGKLEASNIVFKLAPRINAVGRMGEGKNAVKLLTANNYEFALEAAEVLEENNKRRREVDEATLSNALEIIKKHINTETDHAIVLYNESWHPGVIGIIAARLCETYYKPTIVLTVDNAMAKGSARSIQGINIYNILKECGDLLVSFGGHEHAAGLTIEKDKIKPFIEKFKLLVSNSTKNENFKRKLDIDVQIKLDEITPRLIRLIKLFAPYGPANMCPVFMTTDLELSEDIKVMSNKHLKFKVKQNDIVLDIIGFNMLSELENIYFNRKNLRLAYYIEENYWAGKKTVQLRLKGIA